MEPHTSAPHYRRLVQIASILLGLIGLNSVLVAMGIAWSASRGGRQPAGLLLSAMMWLPVGGFGAYGLFVAYRLWKKLSAKSIHDVCGLVAFIVWGATAFWLMLLRRFFPQIPSHIWLNFAALIAAIPAIALLTLSSRWIITHAPLNGFQEAEVPRGVARHHIGLIAFLLWWAMAGVHVERIRGQKRPTEDLGWEFLLFLGPIALALIVYWVGVGLFGQKEDGTQPADANGE